ncbi:MAG: YczE/YyaS/YitT family protein [Acidimicrobiales bacterium]
MGVGIALMVRAELGLGPWDVLHQGLSRRSGVPIGTVTILVGLAVLGLWVPLRQRVGVGTVVNAVVVGAVVDGSLWALPHVVPLAVRVPLLAGGVVAVGVGSGLYIGTGLGPGPRDGLMTGLARRGGSIRRVRTGIELTALAVGWLLGGSVGIGTVTFALSIGPLVQVSLGRFELPPAAVGTGGRGGGGGGQYRYLSDL